MAQLVEVTILGKPVLVPYSGWYADLGFVQNASGKKLFEHFKD